MREFHYAVTYNMPGYLPESEPYPVFGAGARDLSDAIKESMDCYGVPARAIRQVPLRKLWKHIKRHGCSTAHFTIQHGPYVLEFAGLTDGEADALIAQRY